MVSWCRGSSKEITGLGVMNMNAMVIGIDLS
jgi:hypothetical protein